MSVDIGMVNAAGFAAAVLHGGPVMPTLERWRELTMRERRAAVESRCSWVYQEGEARKLDPSAVRALSRPGACVAAMLVAGDCIDAGEAAEAFASINVLLEQDETGLVSRARRLAREWYRDGRGYILQDVFWDSAWVIGKGVPERLRSAFPNADDRDKRRCPLRAGEAAAGLAGAVAAFLSTAQPEQSPKA